jgi:hypothetical protein
LTIGFVNVTNGYVEFEKSETIDFPINFSTHI